MKELTCASGQAAAMVGDHFRFQNEAATWEITAFTDHPTIVSGIVTAKLVGLSTPVPLQFKPYQNQDGTIDFCGDSVAAAILFKQDGKARTARGVLIKDPRLA